MLPSWMNRSNESWFWVDNSVDFWYNRTMMNTKGSEMKTAIDFETKLIEYGTALREYEMAEKLWRSKRMVDGVLYERMDAAEAKVHVLHRALVISMGALAREIA